METDYGKGEISFQLLCNACLCLGRTLYQITDEKLRQYYHSALSEISLCSIPSVLPNVCLDCKALLRRSFEFKEQVKDSYRILMTYSSENLHECLLSDVPRPPRLKIKNNDSIDIKPDLPDYTLDAIDECFNRKNSDLDDKLEDNQDPDIISNETKTKVQAPKESPSYSEIILRYQDTQEVFVKEELKVEEFDADRDSDFSDTPLEEIKSAQSGNLADIDNEIRSIIYEVENSKETKQMKRENIKRSKKNENLADIDNEIRSIICEVENSKEVMKQMKIAKIKRRKDNDNLADIGNDMRTVICEAENNKETKMTRVKVKRSKEKLSGKKKVKKKEAHEVPSILTIDLTYDEMMSERENECTRDNYINAAYKCESCIVGFHYNNSYKKHLVNRHSSSIGKYTCPVCKTVLPTVESFTTHYKRHMRRYECSICSKRTMDLKSMQQHYYSRHEISLKKYKCDDCGKISNSIDSHRYHTDTHKSRLQCPDCEKTFRHRGGLLAHRLAVHESRNTFPCQLCDKVFRWKSSLKRHLDSHDAKSQSTSEAAFCSLCSVSFASLSSYQRHMKNSLQHVTKEDFRFICDHCKKRFADKTKLRDHIEEKHLHKTYQCKICLKTSKNRVNLDQHIRNVHKGRPNNKMCHHCGKGFPTTVQLDSHIRTHTGERPFICEYCPTTFSQQSNLYKHNRQVHLNMKTKRYPPNKKRKEDKGIDLEIGPTDLPIEYPVEIEFM